MFPKFGTNKQDLIVKNSFLWKLLDEAEYDMNSCWYADQGGCHLLKPKAEADNTP